MKRPDFNYEHYKLVHTGEQWGLIDKGNVVRYTLPKDTVPPSEGEIAKTLFIGMFMYLDIMYGLGKEAGVRSVKHAFHELMEDKE